MARGVNRSGILTQGSILEVRHVFAQKYGYDPEQEDYELHPAKALRLKPALEYIEAFYDRQITLSDIARASQMSVFHLSHLFKDHLGITIVDYLTYVRLRRAKILLISTKKSCSEICFEVGYNNQSYFNRIFKELIGITPRQYRVINS